MASSNQQGGKPEDETKAPEAKAPEESKKPAAKTAKADTVPEVDTKTKVSQTGKANPYAGETLVLCEIKENIICGRKLYKVGQKVKLPKSVVEDDDMKKKLSPVKG